MDFFFEVDPDLRDVASRVAFVALFLQDEMLSSGGQDMWNRREARFVSTDFAKDASDQLMELKQIKSAKG